LFIHCKKVLRCFFCFCFSFSCFSQTFGDSISKAYRASANWLEQNNSYKRDVDSAYASHDYFRALEDHWRVRPDVVHAAKRNFSRRFTSRFFKFYGENTKVKLRQEYNLDGTKKKKKGRSLAAEAKPKAYKAKADRLRFAVKPRLFQGHIFMRLKNYHFEVSGLVDVQGHHELAIYRSLRSFGFRSGLEYEAAYDQITAKINKSFNRNWDLEIYQSFGKGDQEDQVPAKDTGIQVRYAVNF